MALGIVGNGLGVDVAALWLGDGLDVGVAAFPLCFPALLSLLFADYIAIKHIYHKYSHKSYILVI